MKNSLSILFFIVIFELIGWLLGSVTQSHMYPWYDLLNKSSLTPPAIVFPIVWSILYALLAICAYILWSNRHETSTRIAGYFFAIQMLMNWSWSLLFFSLHLVTLSFIWIIGILFFTLCVYQYSVHHKAIKGMLIPYMLWLSFAAYLNGVIVFLN
jgi:tryptophan-rich sensory protein